MLSTFHKAISKAFGRNENAEFRFILYDNSARKFRDYPSQGWKDGTGILTSNTNIKEVDLISIDMQYIFDFRRPIWHEIKLIRVYFTVSQTRFPKIVPKQGKGMLPRQD